jgi:glycosyltransferase involved in cell wall biosynthesis
MNVYGLDQRSESNKRRVAIINYWPPDTGIGKYALNLLDQLEGKCDIDEVFLDYGNRSIDVTEKHLRRTIRRLKRLPLIDSKPLFWNRMKNVIPEYDLYHLVSPNPSPILLKSNIIRKKLFIVNCNDLLRYAYPQSKLDYLAGRYIYPSLRKANRVIAISEFTKRELIKYVGVPEGNIRTVYMGIDHKIYKRASENRAILKKFGVPDNVKVILYVGNELPRKNLPTFIKAFGELKKQYGNVKLIKVGSAPNTADRKRLINLINGLGLGNDVIFTGVISEEALPQLYSAADLYVYPSIYEGFGMPVLEAMACGCPVIISKATALPEVAGDAAIAVNPYDIDAWVKAMYSLLTNDSLKNQMIGKGIERAKIFSWEKTAKETLMVYEKVMGIRA